MTPNQMAATMLRLIDSPLAVDYVKNEQPQWIRVDATHRSLSSGEEAVVQLARSAISLPMILGQVDADIRDEYLRTLSEVVGEWAR